MTGKRVLSVGQCAYDHGNVSRMLTNRFGAETVAVATAEDAMRAVESGSHALVLVNRIFDANGESGHDFIRRLKAAKPDLTVMLVSNFPEAQAEAVAIGAVSGFGKAALDQPETQDKLRMMLGG